MLLTSRLVAAALPRNQLYALTDGHGLSLQVTPEAPSAGASGTGSEA